MKLGMLFSQDEEILFSRHKADKYGFLGVVW